MENKLQKRDTTLIRKLFSVFQSCALFAVFVLVVGLFYVYLPHVVRESENYLTFFLATFLSILIFDRLITAFLLFQRRMPEMKEDPKRAPSKSLKYLKDVSVIIASYNGEKIIGGTITHLLRLHISPRRIIVVSDASTDKTAAVARQWGVRVFVNKTNLQKGLSISRVVRYVKTPYVLILDDDTAVLSLRGAIEALEDGRAAACFNVLPVEKKQMVTKLQTYEYRRSMIFGRELRDQWGAIANISGAIGFYRTEDLLFQSTRHSGQVGGEDQQRTALTHLYSNFLGISYLNDEVRTEVPPTWKALFRQRALRWNRAVPENFFLFWKVVWSTRTAFLYKFDRLIMIFVYVTEPLRILGWLFAFIVFTKISPVFFLLYYFVKLIFEFAIYFKTGAKDPWYLPLLYPLYSVFRRVTRYIAHFYWFVEKYRYVFVKKYHLSVPDRNLRLEYFAVLMTFIFIWTSGILVYTGGFDKSLWKQLRVDNTGGGILEKWEESFPSTTRYFP